MRSLGEIWMSLCLFDRNSSLGVDLKHLFQKVNSKGVQVGVCSSNLPELRESGLNSEIVYSEVGKVDDVFAIFNGGGSLLSHDLHDLPDLWLSLEKNVSFCKFKENTSNWPYINFKVISEISQQQLRCPVPQSLDFLRHRFPYFGDNSPKPKVSNLDVVCLVDENVLRFKIPVEYLFAMKIINSIHDLL